MKVEVCTAQTARRFPGPGGYEQKPEGGGDWSVVEERPIPYYYLSVAGTALGGVYMDKGVAERDARLLEKVAG